MTLTDEMMKTPAGRKLLEETRGLVAKWDKTGLLDGLKSDIEKTNMAILLPPQSSLHFDDGTVITYGDEAERDTKLKEYYAKVQRKS
jgi:hypothetical protein